MTFSIAGRCPETGQIGFAVTTSSVCVGARVGAVTDGCVVFSQARTDPRLHRVAALLRNVEADARMARHQAHTKLIQVTLGDSYDARLYLNLLHRNI